MARNALNNKRRQETVGALLLEFFGSINLAITLLVTVGIAALVGAVPRQNEPYQTIWPTSACLNHLRVTWSFMIRMRRTGSHHCR